MAGDREPTGLVPGMQYMTWEEVRSMDVQRHLIGPQGHGTIGFKVTFGQHAGFDTEITTRYEVKRRRPTAA